MTGEEVEEVKNEEATEILTNENIEEETTKEEPKEQTQEETSNTETVEEAKPKAKAKATPKKLPRSVKVVELVACNDCNKKMLPKSLRNTHPHYCKGQPTETLPVNKQKASYGSKVEEKLRKEIEAEMKSKYANKENDKNAQNVKNEVVSFTEPIEVRTHRQMPREAFATQAKPKPIKMEEVPRQLTARELLEASYNEIRKAKREAHIEKINSFKSKMF